MSSITTPKPTKALPFTPPVDPRSAVEVLSECITDIENNLWVRRRLICTFASLKPRGCAIGLVGINGGNLHPSGSSYSMDYHGNAYGDWTHSSQMAARCLAATAITRSYGPPSDGDADRFLRRLDMDTIRTYVVHCNDQSEMVPSKIKAWFVRAIEFAIANDVK